MKTAMSYPSVRFRLRHEKKSSSFLQCFISLYGIDATKFSTNIPTSNETWNQKKQKFEDSPVKNLVLDEIRAKIEETFILMKRTDRPLTAHTLKKQFLDSWRNNRKPLTLLQIYDEYLTEIKTRNLEPKTVAKYEKTKEHLIDYLKKQNRNDLQIEEIDTRTGFGFFNYMKTKAEQPHAKRTLEQFKGSIQFAFETGKIERDILEPVKVKIKHPRTNKTVIDERTQLDVYQLDELSRTERQIADITTFIFYTSFDHCDYMEFDFEKHLREINGVLCVEKRRYKMRKTDTDETVVIPVNAIMKEIIEKYKTHFPQYPDQTVRRVFKNLLSRVGVLEFKKIGLKQLRKSGGTHYLNNDVPLKTVSAKILGHSNTGITEKYYVKIKPETVIRHIEGMKKR